MCEGECIPSFFFKQMQTDRIYTKKKESVFLFHSSQAWQDEALNNLVFENRTNGTFVEFGASDGITFSNSLFFEKYLGWKGLCIEPSSKHYMNIVDNRSSCIPIHGAICAESGRKIFMDVSGKGSVGLRLSFFRYPSLFSFFFRTLFRW